jgi:hypothetical protein
MTVIYWLAEMADQCSWVEGQAGWTDLVSSFQQLLHGAQIISEHYRRELRILSRPVMSAAAAAGACVK